MIDWRSFSAPPVFGLDEVGRGCLAGPVISAAATPKLDEQSSSSFVLSQHGLPAQDPHSDLYLNFFKDWDQKLDQMAPSLSLNTLTDSKKLTEKKREALLPAIRKSFYVSIGIASPSEIDQINILQASLLSMRRAALGLESHLNQTSQHLLIDGIFKIPNWKSPQTTLIKGDLNCDLISAASIVAKVFRDRLMQELEVHYPGYGLADHKGYPSPLHKQLLAQIGPSKIHRLSFKGVVVQSTSDEYRTL